MTRPDRPRPAAIDVHIDELVLVGFDPSDRLRIAAAVERELTALLGAAPPSQALIDAGGVERLDGGSFRRDAGAPPRRIGEQIAAAVHGAVLGGSAAGPAAGPGRGEGGPTR